MPRLFACALLSAFAFVTVTPAAPVPQHLMRSPTYYFPTKVGTKLEYEEPARQLTMIVTAVTDRGGAKVVTVGRVGADDSVSPLMTMCVTGTGLYRLDRSGKKLDVPETWLQLPAQVDFTWEYPARSVAKLSVIGTEEVTVPAGTFRCVGVRHFQDGHVLDCWYAPEVGLVKTEAATWVEVLKSYTPGKD